MCDWDNTNNSKQIHSCKEEAWVNDECWQERSVVSGIRQISQAYLPEKTQDMTSGNLRLDESIVSILLRIYNDIQNNHNV